MPFRLEEATITTTTATTIIHVSRGRAGPPPMILLPGFAARTLSALRVSRRTTMTFITVSSGLGGMMSVSILIFIHHIDHLLVTNITLARPSSPEGSVQLSQPLSLTA